MSTKGSLTWVSSNSFGKKTQLRRRVFWMDGYDAWLCIFKGYGKADQRTSKPTSYRFTFDQDTKAIRLSKGSDDEFAQETVKERTLSLHQFDAGLLISKGFTLTWLNEEETKRCLEYYQTKAKEYAVNPE